MISFKKNGLKSFDTKQDVTTYKEGFYTHKSLSQDIAVFPFGDPPLIFIQLAQRLTLKVNSIGVITE